MKIGSLAILAGLLFGGLCFAGGAGDKVMFVFGASGDPKDKPGTIFDAAIGKLGSYSSHADWNSFVYLDGGHPATEQAAKDAFPFASERGPFTTENFEKSRSEWIHFLTPGNCPKQMMVYIDSHGLASANQEDTHSVSIGPNPGDHASLDNLQSLVRDAQVCNTKLAIIDMSCFSGASQSLAGPGVCVISATTADNYGFADFGELFAQSMQPGKNLEQVFLEARSLSASAATPQISTPMGQELMQMEKSGLTGFLLTNPSNLSVSLLTQLIDQESKACDQKNAPEVRLKNQLTELRKLLGPGADQDPDFQNLTVALTQYQAQQSAIEQSVQARNQILSRRELIDIPYRKKNGQLGHVRGEEWWSSLLSPYRDKILETAKTKMATPGRFDDPNELKAEVEYLEKTIQLRDKIRRENPDLKWSLDYTGDTMKALAPEKQTIPEIVGLERKVYDKIYRREQKNGKDVNACQNFTL